MHRIGIILVTVLLLLVGLGGILAPILIDARRWWPRKRNKHE